MPNDKKCWIIESGEYSYYGVGDVFTSEEAAYAYVEALNDCGGSGYSDYRVAERDLDPVLPEYTAWWAMSEWVPNGMGESGPLRHGTLVDPDRHPPSHPTRPDVRLYKIGGQMQPTMELVVVGYDKEGVIHAFNDRRAKLIVELEQGVVNPEDFPHQDRTNY